MKWLQSFLLALLCTLSLATGQVITSGNTTVAIDRLDEAQQYQFQITGTWNGASVNLEEWSTIANAYVVVKTFTADTAWRRYVMGPKARWVATATGGSTSLAVVHARLKDGGRQTPEDLAAIISGDPQTVLNALGVEAGAASPVAATVVSKTGTRTLFTASADTDAARGIALTNAIQSMSAGQTLHCAPGDYYMAQTNLLLVDDCTYNWNGANLYINGSSASARVGRETVLDIGLFTTGFAVGDTSVTGWKFIGPVTINGNNVTNRRALWAIASTGVVIEKVTFKNWGTTNTGNSQAGGVAFYCQNSTNKGNRMSDCYFDTCGSTGAEFNAEYWVVSNCHAFMCGYGFVESGGNTAFANCSATYCTFGLRITNTSNTGHGTWVGGNVNHSTTGIWTDPTTEETFGGWSFSGCIAHSTRFDLNGRGITFTGGEIGNTTFVSTGTNTGISYFRNVRLMSDSTAESTSLAALSVAKRATLVFEDCRTEAGLTPTWLNSQPSASQVVSGASWQANPLATENWVVEGDSWSAGTIQGNTLETWPFYIAKLVGPQVKIINAATAGETAQTMTGQFATQCAPYLTATSGKPSTCFIFAGINDGGSRTTTQVRDDLRTLWAAARSAGARVVGFTLPFRSAGGGWSEADRLTINAQIRTDFTAATPLFDVLIETDIFQTRNNSEMTGGLHITTAAQAKFANSIKGVLEGRRMMPSIMPDMVYTGTTSIALTASTRADLTFSAGSEGFDANGDVSAVTVGSNAATTAFIAPVAGTYEIYGSVMSQSGLVSGNQFYLDAAIKPPSASEIQTPLDYQIGAGNICSLGRSIRRRLTVGTQVTLLTWSNGTPTLSPNRAHFGVRLVSIP